MCPLCHRVARDGKCTIQSEETVSPIPTGPAQGAGRLCLVCERVVVVSARRRYALLCRGQEWGGGASRARRVCSSKPHTVPDWGLKDHPTSGVCSAQSQPPAGTAVPSPRPVPASGRGLQSPVPPSPTQPPRTQSPVPASPSQPAGTQSPVPALMGRLASPTASRPGLTVAWVPSVPLWPSHLCSCHLPRL